MNPTHAKESLAEALTFGQGEQGVGHGVAEHAEVAHVRGDLDVGADAVEGLVERVLEQLQYDAFLALDLAGRDDVVFGLVRKQLVHAQRVLGRLLQVGIDEADALAACRFHARIQCRLLAEVAGELHGLHGVGRVGLAHNLAQQLEGAVLAAIVHEHDLKRDALRVKALEGAALEQADVVDLVVAGDDEAQAVGVGHCAALFPLVVRVRWRRFSKARHAQNTTTLAMLIIALGMRPGVM